MAEATIPCICPGTPHDEDKVYLNETLSFRQVAALKYDILIAKGADEEMSTGETVALLSELYLLAGINAWTLQDEEAQPIQVSRGEIRGRLLANPQAALLVAEVADQLYAEKVMLPLLGLGWKSSANGSTNGSTSATNGSSPKPRKRSKRSSTSTIPTDVTATTSA